MQSMSLRLPDPLFNQLISRAKANAMSQTELVREAIAMYLASPSKPKDLHVTAYQAGKKWIDQFEGPSDLSSNPIHMQGFGQ
jgi:predicted transcriptional regulator